MGLREDREFLKQLREEREALSESMKKHERDAWNKKMLQREDIIDKHKSDVDNYYKYKDEVQRQLVRKALLELYTQSIYNINSREMLICENLIDQYINDNDPINILRKMKTSQNGFLRVIAEAAKKHHSKITKNAKVGDVGTQTVSATDLSNFWKEIDKSENIEDITSLIRLRVSNAEEEFVNKNKEDKEDIKTILANTAERIKSAQDTTDNDYSTATEAYETKMAKEQIYNINYNRHRNVFDRIVRNLSKAVLLHEDLKREYTEDNKLDMPRIIESARCMYTLLEMVGTLQLEKVDSEYIEDTLRSISC